MNEENEERVRLWQFVQVKKYPKASFIERKNLRTFSPDSSEAVLSLFKLI